MKKTIALVSLGLVFGSAGCRSNPGVALTAGTIATVFGVSIVAQSPPWEPDEEGIGPMVGTAGAGIAVIGAAMMIAGLAGFAGVEVEPADGTATLMRTPSTPMDGYAPAPTTRPRTRSSGAGNEKLALHIRLAARANRCEAALFMMKQLGERDYDLAQALRLGDEHVARCAAATAATTAAAPGG